MYEPLKFKRMKEIAADLNEKLDQLEVGSMSKANLELLTEQSRELYERLVVLRFKAYDQEVKGSTVVEAKEEVQPIQPVINFSISEPKPETSLPGQVSLIDAIEEEISKASAVKEETVEITLDEVNEETPLIIDRVDTESKEAASLEDKEEHNETVQPVAKPQFTSPVSLYDRLTKNISVAETIAEKSEHQSISDLKRAISLNQRFQFSKELFKGNNQEYEVAIDKLNAASRDEAFKMIDTLKGKYSWTEGSAVTNDFIDLVKRRHQ